MVYFCLNQQEISNMISFLIETLIFSLTWPNMNINKNNMVTQTVLKHLTISTIMVTVLATSLLPQTTQAFAEISEKFAKTTQKTTVFPVSGDINPRQTAWVTMTAYSSEVGQTDDTPCIPAMHTYNLCENYENTGAQDTIAANFLPLGTKVRFPDLYGDKIFTVRDRMNKRYGWGRGDFWMPERTDAIKFGVQQVKMEIYYR
jgi:3D (Asp-Asp-Asp) domain-containing protein